MIRPPDVSALERKLLSRICENGDRRLFSSVPSSKLPPGIPEISSDVQEPPVRTDTDTPTFEGDFRRAQKVVRRSNECLILKYLLIILKLLPHLALHDLLNMYHVITNQLKTLTHLHLRPLSRKIFTATISTEKTGFKEEHTNITKGLKP